MSFQKVGMIKTAKVKIIDNIDCWNDFIKQANNVLEQSKSESDKQVVEKEADFQVVASIDPEKFIYIHTTIMAGVKTENNGFWITSDTEKYINDNNDAWTCEDLLSDYSTFKRATTFVEHDQRLENAKGKCIDAIARNMGDTILIDVLFSVDKRHKDLVANIENGIINAVSMGCTTAQTVCSICGNIANDPSTYCEHLKQGNKGRKYRLQDGTTRRSAEICKKNTFFDVSLVANPAFAGAVFRKILSTCEANNFLLANILNSKIETLQKEDSLILKAASKEADIANISIKNNGTIEITTQNQTFIAKETLSNEEIENINSFISKTPKTSTILDKMLEKIFGKKANHPILNQTTEKDFTTPYYDYSDIPYHDRHKTLDDAGLGVYLEIRPIVVLDVKQIPNILSRVDEFECVKCGFKSDLWKVKATSIDNGQKDVIECPRCFYASEENIYKTSTIINSKLNDKVTITNGKEKGQTGTIVSLRGPFAIIKLDNGKVVWKPKNDFEKNKESRLFIASQDIPVDKDEDTYWFDKQGNSVITKGEKISFVCTVDNGEYGYFTTQKGEDFYMPMSYINKK